MSAIFLNSREACLQGASLLWHSLNRVPSMALLQLELQNACVFSFTSANRHFSMYALHHGFVYFLRKTKMVDRHFVNCYHVLLSCRVFAKLIPLVHSTVNAPGTWEVWWLFSNGCKRRSAFDFCYLLL